MLHIKFLYLYAEFNIHLPCHSGKFCVKIVICWGRGVDSVSLPAHRNNQEMHQKHVSKNIIAFKYDRNDKFDSHCHFPVEPLGGQLKVQLFPYVFLYLYSHWINVSNKFSSGWYIFLSFLSEIFFGGSYTNLK